MSIFNKKQIEAMFNRKYICHECGELMEFEDEHEDIWFVQRADTV